MLAFECAFEKWSKFLVCDKQNYWDKKLSNKRL